MGGKSKYKNEIIEKPIINAAGKRCSVEKIKLICQLILRLQLLWIIIFVLIFFGLSSCIATKGLISSVKEIAELIAREEINEKNKRIIKEKVQRIVSRDVSSSSLEHLLRSSTESLTENSVDGIFGHYFGFLLEFFL